ncbi:MAG: tetratricopeptide repeat protein [Bacteroidales bacterium]|nr:tetratricopeptide repeat protein [Bacteroidales bacterium]
MLMKLYFKIICFLVLVNASTSGFGQRFSDENLLMGIAMYERGIKDSALIYLNKSLETDRDNADSHLYLGKVYFEMNQNDEAIKQFLMVEKKQKGPASFDLTKAYAKAGDVEKAIEYLDIHLNSNYKLPESKILLDPDIQTLDNNALWVDYWKTTSSYKGFDESLSSINYLIKSEDYLEAINLIGESLKKSYRKSPLLALRAEIYEKLENYSLAISDLNEAIAGDKRNPELYFSRGKVLLQQEKYKLAVEDFDNAIKFNPKNFKIYPFRAIALQKSGLMQLAASDMNFYLKYFPDDDYAWFTYGEINKSEGLYFDALKCFNKCLEMDKTKADYFLSRGETYFKTRTYKYANRDLAMALDLDPKNAKAYYFKGLTSLKLGDQDHACYCFQRSYEYGMREAYNEMVKYCPLNK